MFDACEATLNYIHSGLSILYNHQCKVAITDWRDVLVVKRTAALPEDPSWVPSSHAWQLIITSNSSSRGSNTPFWPFRHSHACSNTHTHIKKIGIISSSNVRKCPLVKFWGCAGFSVEAFAFRLISFFPNTKTHSNFVVSNNCLKKLCICRHPFISFKCSNLFT